MVLGEEDWRDAVIVVDRSNYRTVGVCTLSFGAPDEVTRPPRLCAWRMTARSRTRGLFRIGLF